MRERRVQLLGPRRNLHSVRRGLRGRRNGRGELRYLQQGVHGRDELSDGHVRLRRTARGLRDRLRERAIGCHELRQLRHGLPLRHTILLSGRVLGDVRLHAMPGRRVCEHDEQ